MRTRKLIPALLIASFVAPLIAAGAQGTLADYQRFDSVTARINPLFVGQPTAPTWLGNTNRFWYRKSVSGGNQWLLVDAATQQKSPLFDHARLATAVATATSGRYTAITLPFATPAANFTLAADAGSITFNQGANAYRCDIAAYTCTRTGAATADGGGRGGRGGGGGAGGGRGGRGGGAPTDSTFVRSGDGRWEAIIVNHNIAVRAPGTTQHTLLSYDGMEGDAYTLSSIRWSPDSRKFAAYRVRPGYQRMIPYIESSPVDQVQPKLTTRYYQKPGDPRDRQLPAVFNVETKKQYLLDPNLIPHAYDLRRPEWRADSRAFAFEYNERGHRKYQVLEINATTGTPRVVVDEQPETFFSYYTTYWRQDVDDGKEILWMSERDGWKHVWLYDGTTGRVKNQVTKGEWVVRGVDSVDAVKRQIWFRANGMYAGKDPYLIHHYRVNFDGTGLTSFNDGDGIHTVSWSPNREYYVDTWSRADQPPVMELRRTSDQRKLVELERTDVTAAERAGWKKPEVFVAKGRDGTTDIWGVIIRPTNFDPAKKYPVIENIYAGPQNHFVPKAFSVQGGMQSLAELGFIVVQIDGMGTAQRSKKFHDVSWKDIGDAGFPDRILWHKAVAAKYAYYDVTRVGIYGGSAGGQNSTGALLFHPEFYDVAVSSVGCHDNRMDKISWNEQWMSYPIGPEYGASSNVDNAHKLQGKLFLIVGELDTNVDPQSTMQVINALVKANKSHDFLFLPGQGHGSGGAFGTRMRNDYFVRHLLGVTPPDWNKSLAAASGAPGGPGDDSLPDWLNPVDEESPRMHEVWK